MDARLNLRFCDLQKSHVKLVHGLEDHGVALHQVLLHLWCDERRAGRHEDIFLLLLLLLLVAAVSVGVRKWNEVTPHMYNLIKQQENNLTDMFFAQHDYQTSETNVKSLSNTILSCYNNNKNV